MPLAISPSGGGGTTFSDPVESLTSIGGRYWIRVKPQGIKTSLEPIKAPAVNGAAVKNHGLAERVIEIPDVVYVSGSAAGCRSMYEADLEAMAGKECVIDLPHSIQVTAWLEEFAEVKGPKPTGHATYRLHCMMRFRQYGGF